MITAVIAIFGTIFTGVLGFFSYWHRKKLVQLRSVDLSDVKDLEEGVCKIYGQAIGEDEPIKSPITGTPCFYYLVEIEEEQVRLVNYTERRGNTIVKGTREERKWVNILHEMKYVFFAVKDDTGEASVDMENSTVVVKEKSRKASGSVRQLPDKAFGRICRLYPAIESKLQRAKCRYTETIIIEDDTLLVMGPVTFDKKDHPTFAYEKKKPFIVSDQSDENLQKHFKNRFIWCLIGAIVFLIGTIVGIILTLKK